MVSLRGLFGIYKKIFCENQTINLFHNNLKNRDDVNLLLTGLFGNCKKINEQEANTLCISQ